MLKVRHVESGTGADTILVALVTDIHVGGEHVSADRVAEIVDRINALEPDLVLIPGDFIDGHTPKFERSRAFNKTVSAGLSGLARLDAPVFATLGNHDSWYGAQAVRAMLEAAGVSVLDNAASHWRDYCIAGLADSDTAQPTRAAFGACDATDTVIAMMHSPDARSLLRADTALAVAGHTHGGQVNLPLLGRAVTSTRCGKPCAYGWIQSDPPLYVSSGIGTSILPIRFRSPPEIVLVTLRHRRREGGP